MRSEVGALQLQNNCDTHLMKILGTVKLFLYTPWRHMGEQRYGSTHS